MNFSKKTLFWIIILISLAGAFHFFDQEKESEKRIVEASFRLLPFNVPDVSTFWINNLADHLKITAMRDGDAWKLAQPLVTKGDKEAIEKYLKIIVTARKDAVLFSQPTPEKLKELGLDNPMIEVGLTANGKETVIIFGEKGPTLNISYAMFKGNPEVYRVHSDLRAESTKDAYALRDKTIIDFDPVKMKRLEIVQKGKAAVVIEQDNGKWNMLEPSKGQASMEKVLDTLFSIKNGKIKAFINDQPADFSAYGLDSPKLTLTVYMPKKATPYKLLIGDKDRKNRGYFAITEQADKVFDVEEELVKVILLNMDKYLEKDSVGG
ncbi:MAG: DUF4340 domain-containing protein [Mariprofundus sp.]|nr:DUF4340 domain-containing protein [Mariprofundus sp.]